MDFTRIGDESADVQILLWDAMFLLGLDPVEEVLKKLGDQVYGRGYCGWEK
jgi:hypothetical protein